MKCENCGSADFTRVLSEWEKQSEITHIEVDADLSNDLRECVENTIYLPVHSGVGSVFVEEITNEPLVYECDYCHSKKYIFNNSEKGNPIQKRREEIQKELDYLNAAGENNFDMNYRQWQLALELRNLR